MLKVPKLSATAIVINNKKKHRMLLAVRVCPSIAPITT
jgi:hypothetical protein